MHERALSLAKPIDPTEREPTALSGLVDRRNWDRFTLMEYFAHAAPHLRFFKEPSIAEWPATRLRDYVQYQLARTTTKEEVGIIMDAWEALKRDQDATMRDLAAKRRQG